MRHLGLLGRLTLAGVFAFTNTLWAATTWKSDADIAAALKTNDTNISNFVDAVHKHFEDNRDTKLSPSEDWKKTYLPPLKDELQKLVSLKDKGDNDALVDELNKAKDAFELDDFKVEDYTEARGVNPCYGKHCNLPSEDEGQTKPLSDKQVKPVADLNTHIRHEDEGYDDDPPPRRLPPPPPPAADISAGVSVSGGGGLGGLFGGGGSSVMPALLGALVGGFAGYGLGQRNAFGGGGGMFGGMGGYGYGASSMYPGLYGGNRFGMFGPGGMYGQGGAFGGAGLPAVYRAPGFGGGPVGFGGTSYMGAGYSGFGGVGGAPAILPFVQGTNVTGAMYQLPPMYQFGSTPLGVH